MMDSEELTVKIRELKKDGLIVLGVGNILKGDDGVGSILASELKKEFPDIVYDCGVSPENYISKCANSEAKNVLIVDALAFGGKPGEIIFTTGENIKKVPIPTTHGPTLQLVIEILRSMGKGIYILGIEPKSCEMDKPLSEEVKEAYENLVRILRDVLT